MSEFWKGPARNDQGYKRARLVVLDRDSHRCRLGPMRAARGARNVCTHRATQAHHLDGVDAGNLRNVDRMVAACANCNAAEGDPTRHHADPIPMIHTWWESP